MVCNFLLLRFYNLPDTTKTLCLFFFRKLVIIAVLPHRMDENFNILPHGVNFQDPIFTDTADHHRMFASLFQFSNCTPDTQVHSFSPEWEAQEDSRVFILSDPPVLIDTQIVRFLHSWLVKGMWCRCYRLMVTPRILLFLFLPAFCQCCLMLLNENLKVKVKIIRRRAMH